MAALVRKLVKNPHSPPLRILASLNKAHPPDLHQSPLPPLLHQNPNSILPCLPDRGARAAAPPLIHHSFQIYHPNFPNWVHLGSIPQPEIDHPDAETAVMPEPDDEADDRTVRADSVKKKRKRKMNKHKYRKLRKCLRRKT